MGPDSGLRPFPLPHLKQILRACFLLRRYTETCDYRQLKLSSRRAESGLSTKKKALDKLGLFSW
ncbi:MAG: hypothetical protein AAB459_04430 [Patescibacteria group bacterium]